MSTQYPGGVIRSTPVTPSGPYQDSTAPGIWTLDQATDFIKQGNWPTAGNVSPSAFIENLFQTWLYTGNGSTQTITNGIDLAGKGGLVWLKNRGVAASHYLMDSARSSFGARLSSNNSNAQVVEGIITSVTSTGFNLSAGDTGSNANGASYASWTFREQAKFFDVVTYTGNGTTQTINHNLGSIPGCIIVKSASSGSYDWAVYHRSLGATKGVYLNTTQAEQTNNSLWNDTTPTSTQFTVGNSGGASSSTNANGVTYVAYLFAHNAGGFGLTGTDNVISCGSFSISGSDQSVNLGYEPQWLLLKNVSSASDWLLTDTMRGMPVGGADANLRPNNTNAEGSFDFAEPTATGFVIKGGSLGVSGSGIYIAIRRGPMKTPTTGTSVFSPVARVGTGATANVTAGFAPDTAISAYRTAGEYMPLVDKLRGPTNWLTWQQLMTNAESTAYSGEWFTAFTNTGVTVGADNSGGKSVNSSGGSLIQYYFQRAPGFFDTVCYTGTDVNGTAVPHNLTVAPEFIIAKRRASTSVWLVYQSSLGTGQYLLLSSNATPSSDVNMWGNTTPTSSNFYVGSSTNFSGFAYVSYLFATCPGVSKVGSFTGTNAVQTINCGFTGGARFVLIKRTDSVGDWYIWDSARGITSGNDPYLLINATAAEVTGTNYVDAAATGFVLNGSGSPVNSNGGTYIFLAIA